MSTYKIKEIFYSLQGEGFHAGRPAIFVRFTGCNLWSGRKEDRAQAICSFCDTDFVGTDGSNGGTYKASELADTLEQMWPDDSQIFVVLTGGEPLLQVDQALVDALRQKDIYLALETNGTKLPPKNIDWICVSPKTTASLQLTQGQEFKLVFPQGNMLPSDFDKMDFKHFFLQPMDGNNLPEHTKMAIDYCLRHPQWKLSIQIHKVLGIE